MSESATRTGALFIIAAPSGAGKTSLVRRLVATLPELLVSVSHTTRAPRPHERHEVDYYFVSEEEFNALLEQNRFLEHATVFDHSYATSRAWVEQQLAQGQDVILEIDWQGAQQVRSRLDDTVSIFILPPSLDALEQRLLKRGDDADSMRRRLREALSDIEHCDEYDYLVVNDEFDRALEQLAAIIIATRHNYRRQRVRHQKLLQEILQQH
ncbi:MAG: guanylate kinase [Gammaproteobacteria bacterium]|nr:guanylate kinase [Gammaproteobacteria bacterium]